MIRNMYTKNFLLMTGIVLLLAGGCSTNEGSDAYGQFEATRITVSSRMGGELIRFKADEGDVLKAGARVGLTDTTSLALQRDELEAQLLATQAKIVNIDAQIEVQQEQLETTRTDLNRTRALLQDKAATQKQMDDIRGRFQILQKQISALETQKQAVRAEIQAIQSRISQVNEQLKDAWIINPVNGTVLRSYAERHELVQAGTPLYQIASLDTLDLRVYISGAQLPSVKIGGQAEVLVDKNAKEDQVMRGTVSWIASEAEFTPKMIQTKEERVTQVYAVKIRVPNPEGILKIGMPGEVNFSHGSSRMGTD